MAAESNFHPSFPMRTCAKCGQRDPGPQGPCSKCWPKDWVAESQRAHPWIWRWMRVCSVVQRTWDWILDKPYWTHTGDDLELRRLRSGALVDSSEYE